MDAKLLQFSMVVLGRTHNPTLLNPDFLTLNGIVPKEWNWEVAETITTPPMAMVRYTSGLTITVEHHKLQVADVEVGPDPSESKTPAIARAYVETLPHVRYAAVGANFQSGAETDDPGGLLKDCFLKPGAWDRPPHALQNVGLRLVYPLTGGRLILSLDAGEAEQTEAGESGTRALILANGNFHRDCDAYPAVNQVRDCIDAAEDDWRTYQALLAQVLPREKKE